MINQDLKNTKFVFDKMKKLYPSFVMPDEIDVEVWTEILEGYSQTDILEALKAYRKNVPYNVAPTPAAFKAFLQHSESVVKTVTQEAMADYAWQRMDEDIAKGECRWNLPTYRMAERIVIDEWLAQEMPTDLWARMDYYSRIAQAKAKGLFDRFDEALELASMRKFGRPAQFESENDIKSAKNARSSRDYRVKPDNDSLGLSGNGKADILRSSQRMTSENNDGVAVGTFDDAANVLASHWKMGA